MKRHRIVYWTGFCVILALLFVAPLVLPEFWRRFLTEILIWGLLAMSSDILIGYTGMVSFGHSAFFGLGMYGAAAALLMVRPPNLWLAIVYGLIGSAGVALFVAYFSTRLRDIYFAITTLIFSQIFYVIIFTWTEVTGGENGLTFSRPALAIPGLFSVPFSSETLHWFVLAVVTASYLILRRITQSPFGMVLQSIRENEARTRAIGYAVERYKIMSVMLSGLFAGWGFTKFKRLLTPVTDKPWQSVNLVIAVVVYNGTFGFLQEFYFPTTAKFVLLAVAPCALLVGFGAAVLQRTRSEYVAPVVS